MGEMQVRWNLYDEMRWGEVEKVRDYGCMSAWRGVCMLYDTA